MRRSIHDPEGYVRSLREHIRPCGVSRLTDNEKKVIAALRRLEKIWEKHGDGLVLFNGNSLRRGASSDTTIETFPGIRGDGGDGGDCF